MELLPGGRVGAGREFEQHWAVINRAGRLLLQFYGNGEPIATLEKRGDGFWHGLGREPGCDIVLKEPADGVASRFEDGRPLLRSAEDLVGALAQPTWFAIGYDAERAFALESALALLNDVFDDVPERIVENAARHPIALQWRNFLDRLASNLAIRRDQRTTNLRRDEAVRPKMLAPGHYARPY
jgi:hypothetical protein